MQDHLQQIAARAMSLRIVGEYALKPEDVEALVRDYHETVEPLRLEELANPSNDQQSFMHDLCGIIQHQVRGADRIWSARYAYQGKLWLIRSTHEYDSEFYWSNRNGWGDLESATLFTEEEKAAGNLPICTEWAEARA